jgi:hypothetical protein
MFKQLVIGIFVSFVVTFSWTHANAGCAIIGGTPMCASWIKGSGMPIGVVTQKPQGIITPTPSNSACPAVESCSPGVDGPDCFGGVFDDFVAFASPTAPDINLKLAGTEGTNCGLGASQNDDCDIKGTAVCGASTKKNVTTPGPLTVFSPGFAQSDESTNSANFRFQLSTNQQESLCGPDTFIAFFAKEGFYEACLDDGSNSGCVQEFCTADQGGIQTDEVRPLHCKPI